MQPVVENVSRFFFEETKNRMRFTSGIFFDSYLLISCPENILGELTFSGLWVSTKCRVVFFFSLIRRKEKIGAYFLPRLLIISLDGDTHSYAG